MLPQLAGIPLQSTGSSADSAQNVNRLLPVGQNVSATVVAVSQDQVQPEIFRLKLEINNRLIQMGVFQPLPVGQKINVNRQSDGQIQITLQTAQNSSQASSSPTSTTNTSATTQQSTPTTQPQSTQPQLKLQLSSTGESKIPADTRVVAAVISSRPVYPALPPATASGTNTAAPAASGSTIAINSSQPSTKNPIPSTQQSSTPNTQVTSPSGANTAAPSSSTAAPQSSGLAQTTSTPGQTALQTNAANQGPQSPLLSNTATTGQQSTTSQTAPLATGGSATITTALQTTAPAVPTNNVQGTTNTQTSPGGNTQPATASSPTQAPPATGNLPTTTTTATATTTVASTTPAQNSTTQPIQNTGQLPRPEVATDQRPAQAASSSTMPTTTAQAPARPIGPPIHHIVTLAMPDGSKVETTSPQPIQQGTQIQLIKQAGPELQIIRMQQPSLTPSSALDQPAIQETLRNALPAQLPTGSAFTQLAQAADSTQASQISSVVRSMLQLFGVRPGSPEASSQIRNNVELGGLATERNLSKGVIPAPQDMKSQLKQLQQLADKLPEEQRERFEQLLRGIHSRVTSQQLNSLQQWRELPDGGFERVIQLDLPIKQGDHWENLELKLSREGGTNAAGEMVSVWRVRLHFDLEEQGGVDAEIRLTDEHEISTLFWCEHKETADLLRQRSEEFSERLQMCGFNNSEVNWHEGTAPSQKQVIHKQLIDLHT